MTLVISGVIDGPLPGGLPKAIELTAVEDIPDLAIYGLGSANNGGGSDGQEFDFPAGPLAAGPLAAGENVYVTTDEQGFADWFGFAPTHAGSGAASVNGDDAIELYRDGAVIDLFGQPDTDGTGTAWEYQDGWAYRKAGTGPSPDFDPADWTFSAPGALDGAARNAEAATPFPTGSYGGGDTGAPDVTINELRISSAGDTDESSNYVEVSAAPGTSLDGLSLVVVSGEFAPGQVDYAFDLGGLTVDEDGRLLIRNADLAAQIPQAMVQDSDLVADFDVFGSPSTLLLVRDFDGAPGDDLDIEDDGMPEGLTGTVIDSVSLVDGDGTPDVTYSGTVVGPDGDFTAAGAARLAGGGFAPLPFGDLSGDTPGAANRAGDGTGDDAIAAAVYEIQGAGHISPFVLDDGQGAADFLAIVPSVASVDGALVVTGGIVTATGGNGFYLQDGEGDGDATTSDAIFVFTGGAPGVATGDAVEVQGFVSEFFPGGASSRNLPTTQIAADRVTVTGTGTVAPVTIGAAGVRPADTEIDGDSFASFDPGADGIDFFEALEGMLVTVSDAVAVSGTNGFGEIFAAADMGASASGLSQRGTLNISPDDFNPERIQIDADPQLSGFDAPLVDTGAALGDVTGVVDYDFGNFQIVPTEDFSGQVGASDLTPEVSRITGEGGRLTVASYNVLNLDPNDDDNLDGTPGTGEDDLDVANGRFTAIAEQIVGNLDAPDILGLQEIQDNNGTVGMDGSGVTAADETLQLLVDEIAAAGGPRYAYLDNPFIIEDASGGFPGGNIRNVFLYKADEVSLVEGSLRAIGSQAPGGAFEGARLPLVADFVKDGETVKVINNHLSSKGGSAPILGMSQPFEDLQEDPSVNVSLNERRAQAQEVNDFIDGLLADDPDANVVVTGDMNEFEFVSPLEIMAGTKSWTGSEVIDTPGEAVLTNLTDTLDPDERYSYNFQGNSQSLDHILVSRNIADGAEFDPVHVNSEFGETPATASDHDPILASLSLGGAAPAFELGVERVARSAPGAFDEGAAEIVAYEDGRYFVTNADAGTVDVFGTRGANLVRIDTIEVGAGGANSVAVNGGIVAVAVSAEKVTDPGFVKLYDAETRDELATFDAKGALPDMLTFSKNGSQIFVAIEGEPDDEYTVDPEGGLSVVDLNRDDPSASEVTFAGFGSFDGARATLEGAGVRIFGPGASLAQDLEPEYIAEGNGELMVTLQEANAFGIFDIASKSFTDIVPLGFKDHALPGNGLDASNEDGGVNIENYPIFGMYQPDAIASYEVDGRTYYVTANEGDSRDYDGFSEEAEVQDVTLDPTAFPDAAALQAPEAIGELGITTTRGDTDGDGDFDELYVYGARSFAIWDEDGALVSDSGDLFEQVIARELPADLFNVDNTDPFDTEDRSDDKGPEPEAIAMAEVGGRQIAVIGLERQNGLVFMDVTDPEAPEYIRYVGTIDLNDRGTGDTEPPYPMSDLGPEGIAVIPAENSASGKVEIAAGNEVSGTVSVYTLENLLGEPEPEPETGPYTLELLHLADQEAASGAIVDAPNLSAVMNALEAQDLGNDGVEDNTIRLSSGDAFIPGVFYAASEAVFGSAGIADIQIQNELGLQAIALGNHEFDNGTGVLAGLISGDADGDFSALATSDLAGQEFEGTAFPYLSANLDFSTDPNLAPLEVEGGQPPIPNAVTSSTVLEENGELIGVVGATTPTLPSISSTGELEVNPDWAGTSPTGAELDELAGIIQGEVDTLLSDNPGMNKVVLLAHMQQLDIELDLAGRLSSVDVIVAGGSNTRLFDGTDRARAGDSDQGPYPQFVENADGGSTAVVNTDGSYTYVGRLVVEFDAEGRIIPESYDPEVSGAYATDAQGVADLGAGDLVDREIQAIADAIEDRIIATESNVFGRSEVFLNGNRSGTFAPADPNGVRTQETNLGNLTADANLAIARGYDETVQVSIKNGGGIRASIGEAVVPPGGTEAVRTPNGQIVNSEGEVIKPEGGISQNDIATALAFNNGLSLVTLSREGLVAVLEHGVAQIDSSAGEGVAGQFPQLAGVRFSFNEARAPGDRIVSAAITDGEGNDLDVLVRDGEIVGDASADVRIVTLNFLAEGGDGYPFPDHVSDRVDLHDLDGDGETDGAMTGAADFAADGTEQDALAEYLAANFATEETAYDMVDAGPVEDDRIQNLIFRDDTVIDDGPAASIIFGEDGGIDRIMGTEGDDIIVSGGGRYDFQNGGAGADTFVIGDEALNGIRERDVIDDFEVGVDRIALAPGVEIASIREAGPQVVLYLDDPEGRNDAIFMRGDGVTADTIDITTEYTMLGLTA